MFLLKNRILATFSGDVLARNLLTTRPAVLNVRSLGTLVAGIDSVPAEADHISTTLGDWDYAVDVSSSLPRDYCYTELTTVRL